MKDVKRLAVALKKQGNKCQLHRDDELYEATDAAEQAEILARQANDKLKNTEAIISIRRTQSQAASQATKSNTQGMKSQGKKK